MKKDIENEIRNFIEKNPDTTVNQVSKYMTKNKISSRMTTLSKIDNMKTRKIIEDRKMGNSFHHLFINDSSVFFKIEIELTEIEGFINRANSFFRTSKDDSLAHADTNDEDEQKSLDRRNRYTLELERIYRETVTRILEDIFIIGNDKLSKKDTEQFYKKIIELKSNLAYHQWTKDIETSYFKLQMKNIKRIENDMKNDKALVEYLEQSKLDIDFLRPFEVKTQKFLSNLF